MLFNSTNIFNTLDILNNDIKCIILKYVYLEDNLKIIRKQKKLKKELNKEFNNIYNISNDFMIFYILSSLVNIDNFLNSNNLNSNISIQFINNYNSNIIGNTIDNDLFIPTITFDIIDNYNNLNINNEIITSNILFNNTSNMQIIYEEFYSPLDI